MAIWFRNYVLEEVQQRALEQWLNILKSTLQKSETIF